MEDILINDTATVAYSRRNGTMFRMSSGVGKRGKTNGTGEHTIAQPNPSNIGAIPAGNGDDIYPWGDSNTLPHQIIADARKNTIIPSTLAWKAEALYGSGVGFGYKEYQGDKEVLVPAQDKFPEIRAFFESRKMRRYIRQSSKAYYWFKNIFPELVLSKDRKQIVSIASQRPEYCRYKREKDDSPGRRSVKNVVVDANWEDGHTNIDTKYGTVVPLIDPYRGGGPQDNDVEWLRTQSGYKYIYPVCDPTPGTTYYQEAEWHTVRTSGWLKIVEEIPKFKGALLENQISPKYLIEISTWWWNWKYPNFEDFTTEKKKELMEAELTRFNDFMAGSANAGQSLMVTFNSDPSRDKEYPGWKITPIKNEIPDGIYNTDSQEGNSHLMYALGVDPVLRGFTPGAKMASGGSEKRVAWNNHLLVTKPHQDDILEPLEFIRDYNGWDPNLRFWFKNFYQATLDVAREPQQQSS